LDPHILLLDIETAPNLGYVWGKWEQNVIDFKHDWYVLSFAYKWLNEKKIHVKALPDYPGYSSRRENDKRLVVDIWKLLDIADVVIAHNGDRFDLRKSNARFISHGLRPPSPYKSVDTLKIARRHFKFDSNRLDDLGSYLGVGRKLPHTGKHLWLGCMNGDKRAWTTMRRYNRQDVALLERVYLKLRPWSSAHPNLNLYTRASACQVCQSPKIARNGRRALRTGYRQQFRCQSCGHQFYDGPIMRYED
jgi:RNase_H superfamily